MIDGYGINAFALPGGNIYITKRMVDFARSEAEIAAVIAHEISHVDLRHCIERFQYELLVRRIVPSDVAAIANLPYSLLNIAYSKQQEREADTDAMIIMAKTGYHPKYDLWLADRLGQLEQRHLTTPPAGLTQEMATSVWQALQEYFQTHPSSPDRIREMVGVLQRNEGQWSGRKFYVGRSNHIQRRSWASDPIDAEFRPYDEPPVTVDYLATDGYRHFKAMAVHVPSGLSSVASDEATPAASILRAVAQCELKIKPCQLYALGDTVVLNKSPDELKTIRSEYSRTGQTARGYRPYLLESDFKALAVDQSSGQTSSSVGQDSMQKAIELAMGSCSGGGAPCQLYAVGNVVVQGLPKDQVAAAIEQYRQQVVAAKITKAEKDYLQNPTYAHFKALAVDYQSGYFAVSQAQLTPSKAIKQAIAVCSSEAHACGLHAIGGKVVKGKNSDEQDAIANDYGRETIERIFENQFKEYMSKRNFKVFVANVPSNSWAYSSGQWHPQAALNDALRKCRGSAPDCQIVALGDTFIFDKPKNSLSAAIDEYNAKVDWPSDIRNPFRDYVNEAKFTDFKVLVVDPNSNFWYRNWAYPSLSPAIEVALGACRKTKPSCELYAVGNHIVYGQSADERNETIATYTREVLDRRLEFFKQPPYTNFKAIAGNPNSMLFSMAYGRESASDAVHEAMESCTAQYQTCQIFAVGNLVVFGLPQDQIDKAVEEYQHDKGVVPQMSN